MYFETIRRKSDPELISCMPSPFFKKVKNKERISRIRLLDTCVPFLKNERLQGGPTGRAKLDTWEKGFTLVELMVTLVLTSIAAVGIYRGYLSYLTSYDVQEQVVEMQQNLRVAMNRMVKEFRMGGYDPTGAGVGGFDPDGTDSGTEISFTMDLNEDGVIGTGDREKITYRYDDSDNSLDRRVDDGNFISVIHNVDALDFQYLQGDGTTEASSAEEIRVIQISLVVCTTNEDYSYTNNDTYFNQREMPEVVFDSQGDHCRRRVLHASVQCRNMGL